MNHNPMLASLAAVLMGPLIEAAVNKLTHGHATHAVAQSLVAEENITEAAESMIAKAKAKGIDLTAEQLIARARKIAAQESGVVYALCEGVRSLFVASFFGPSDDKIWARLELPESLTEELVKTMQEVEDEHGKFKLATMDAMASQSVH